MPILFKRSALPQPHNDKPRRWIRHILTVLCLLLLVVVLLAPGALELLYRADARAALRNARSLKTALEVTAIEKYGSSAPFADGTAKGGVTEDVYEDVLFLSKAPGDFWVLQTDDSGYRVESFLYQENEYTVWYDRTTKRYTVYHDRMLIGDEETAS